MEATLVQAHPGLMTAEDLERLSPDFRCELIDGELVRMSPSSGRHGQIGGYFAGLLRDFLKEHPLGDLFISDAGFVLQRSPDTVRGPDVAFISRERLHLIPETGFIPFPADLIVEVVSPNDSFTKVTAKVEGWLQFGVRLIWVADPAKRRVHVFSASGAKVLHEADTLTGGDVLPGFAVPVRQFFP